MKPLSLFIVLLFAGSCVVSQKNIRKSDDHHKIAVGLINECDNPRALSHLLKALKLNPGNFLIRYTLATVYYVMNRHDKVLVELKKILKQKPDFTEARVTLARTYIDLNQSGRSLKELEKAEKDMTYSGYLKIVSQKGLAHYQQGNYSISRKWLEEALSLPKGKNCFVYLNLGRTELAMSKLKKSEKYLKKALSFCPKEKRFCAEPSHEEHMALAQVYIKKKDKRRARYHLNLFLRKTKAKAKIKKAKKLLKEIS